MARARVFIALLLIFHVLVRAGAASSRPAHEGQAPQLVMVSEDPYTNPGTYHPTQVEPVSAAFCSTIVSVFQSGRSTYWDASNLGWSVSNDAGLTWTARRASASNVISLAVISFPPSSS